MTDLQGRPAGDDGLLADLPLDVFAARMDTAGWVLCPQVLATPVVATLHADLQAGYEHCREVQARQGIVDGTEGTAHHLLGLRPGFLDLLDRQTLAPYLSRYFGGNYILNSYGGVIHRRGVRSYVGNTHRDIRSFVHGLPLMLNMLVMLDDFTLENGATFLYPGSHRLAEAPAPAAFVAGADRAVGNAGDIVLFNSGIWHAAGDNQSDGPRRGLTLTFTVPYFKPQMDYVTVLGTEAVAAMPPHLQQVLGYFARVPGSLEDWYQPPEKRFYRPGQG